MKKKKNVVVHRIRNMGLDYLLSTYPTFQGTFIGEVDFSVDEENYTLTGNSAHGYFEIIEDSWPDEIDEDARNIVNELISESIYLWDEQTQPIHLASELVFDENKEYKFKIKS